MTIQSLNRIKQPHFFLYFFIYLFIFFIYLFFFFWLPRKSCENSLITSGPSCSKLTTSLVNVTLKFQTYYHKNTVIFCRKKVRSFCCAKAPLIFSAKNISTLDFRCTRRLNELPRKSCENSLTVFCFEADHMISIRMVPAAYLNIFMI